MGRNSIVLFAGHNDSRNNHSRKIRPEKEVAREVISLLYNSLPLNETIEYLNNLSCSMFPECINGSVDDKERWIMEQITNIVRRE